MVDVTTSSAPSVGPVGPPSDEPQAEARPKPRTSQQRHRGIREPQLSRLRAYHGSGPTWVLASNSNGLVARLCDDTALGSTPLRASRALQVLHQGVLRPGQGAVNRVAVGLLPPVRRVEVAGRYDMPGSDVCRVPDRAACRYPLGGAWMPLERPVCCRIRYPQQPQCMEPASS